MKSIIDNDKRIWEPWSSAAIFVEPIKSAGSFTVSLIQNSFNQEHREIRIFEATDESNIIMKFQETTAEFWIYETLGGGLTNLMFKLTNDESGKKMYHDYMDQQVIQTRKSEFNNETTLAFSKAIRSQTHFMAAALNLDNGNLNWTSGRLIDQKFKT